MTVTIPQARDGTSLPESFTVCVSASAEERGRVAAALDAHGLLVLVPDAQMAVDLLLRAAGRDPDLLQEADGMVRLGPLEVDRRRATVTWGDVQVDVSHLEMEVLACLAATPGVVWSYERLHEAAWGSRYVGDRASRRSRARVVGAGGRVTSRHPAATACARRQSTSSGMRISTGVSEPCSPTRRSS
jgi:two-component system, OmpR family, response regulator MtrA